MSVRTGTGDTGYTGRPQKKYLKKESAVISAVGDLDEFVSYLGLVKVKLRALKDKAMIEKLQKIVSAIMSEITVSQAKEDPQTTFLNQNEVDWIENSLVELEAKVKMRDCFYLPGTNEISACLDVARTVARRAERSVAALLHGGKTSLRRSLVVLNCASDILFIMARDQARSIKKKK